VRDYDGDTIVDIVTVDAQAGTLSFLRGKGDGTFEEGRGFFGRWNASVWNPGYRHGRRSRSGRHRSRFAA
jgi:hypothetical protein